MSRHAKRNVGTIIRVVILVIFFLMVVLPIYWIVATSLRPATRFWTYRISHTIPISLPGRIMQICFPNTTTAFCLKTAFWSL